MAWRGLGHEGDMGMERTRIWKGHGYGSGRDMGMKRTWVWKGQRHGGDMGMEGTCVCRRQ